MLFPAMVIIEGIKNVVNLHLATYATEVISKQQRELISQRGQRILLQATTANYNGRW